MTSFNRLRVGKAGTPLDTTLRGSLDNNVAGVYEYPPKEGVGIAPFQFFDVVPLVIVANNIATSQTPTGAVTLTAGTGVTSATVNGTSVLALDCARCVTVTGVGGTSAVNFTIVGFDDYQQPMSEVLLGPAGATTTTTAKAFRYITSITVASTTTAAITIGTSDTIGLPYRADKVEYVNMCYAGARITASTGFTGADTTSPATTTTDDVRGTYALQSASDGSKRFTAEIYLKNVDTVTGVWGVKQV